MVDLLIFFAISILLSLFAIIPLFKSEAWWIRVFDFPRLQSWVFALLLLVLELLILDLSELLSWAPVLITLAFVLFQGWWIYPYSIAHPKEVMDCANPVDAPRIKLLCANVLTPNRKSAGLLHHIQELKPDLFVALESDQWWEDQFDQIAGEYPYQVKCPLDNLYGMHVYSKLAFADQALEFLVEDDVPSIHLLIKLKTGDRVRFHFLHPAPPSPTENPQSTERDAELTQVALYCQKQALKHDIPVIVAGDLNDVAWSATTRLFRKVSGLLDPRVGRGMFNSFHASYWPLRWPLDHVFHSHHFTVVNMRRLEGFGSDHFPIFLELALQPAKKHEQDGLSADAGDYAWAREKISNDNDAN